MPQQQWPGQQGAWTAPGGQPPKKKRTGCLIAAVIVAIVGLVVVAGLVQVFKDFSGDSDSSAQEPFAVGDCLTMDNSTMELARVDCSDPAAQQEVVEVLPADSFADCIGIDGAQSGVAQSEPEAVTLCTGEPGVDPSKSVNNIEAGECLVFDESTQNPHRVDCGEPEALRVDGRLDDVMSPNDPNAPPREPLCAEAGLPESEMVLHFGITGMIDGVQEEHYRVACLSRP